MQKILEDPVLSCVATGIELAMFRDGPTRLTTRAVDIEGRAYTEHRNKVSHFEKDGPDENITLRLSKFKQYQVYSYVNPWSAMLFARYLNCIKLHKKNLRITRHASYQDALMEIRPCYVLCFKPA